MKKRDKFYKSGDLFYNLGKLDEGALLKKEFELSIKRTVLERIRRGVIKTYKPVMDGASYRIFTSLEEYKKWCKKNLPAWLGYG